MGEDVERLKRRMPLLDYLRQQNWAGRPASRFEYGGALSITQRKSAVVLREHAQKCLLLSRLRAGWQPDSLGAVITWPVLPAESGLS